MKKILFIGLLFVLAGTGVWSQEVSDSVRIHYRRGYGGWIPITTTTVPNWNGFIPYPAQGTGVGPSGTCRNLLVDIARRGDPLQRAACRPPCRLAEILACAPRTDSGELVSVRGEGIGWGVLRQLVAVSDMLYKDEVLHILDNTPVWIRDSHGKIVDGRKKQLMDLRGGQPYNYMMENIFPEVRSSLSTICYRKSAPSIDKVTTGTAPTDSALAEKEETETAGFRNTAALISAGPGADHSGGDLPGNLAEGFREIAGSTRPKPGDQDQSALRCPAHAIAGGGIPLQ